MNKRPMRLMLVLGSGATSSELYMKYGKRVSQAADNAIIQKQLRNSEIVSVLRGCSA